MSYGQSREMKEEKNNIIEMLKQQFFSLLLLFIHINKNIKKMRCVSTTHEEKVS